MLWAVLVILLRPVVLSLNRILNACTHVIDETVPGPPQVKPSLPSLPNASSLSPVKRKVKGGDKEPSSPATAGQAADSKTPQKNPSKGWYCRKPPPKVGIWLSRPRRKPPPKVGIWLKTPHKTPTRGWYLTQDPTEKPLRSLVSDSRPHRKNPPKFGIWLSRPHRKNPPKVGIWLQDLTENPLQRLISDSKTWQKNPSKGWYLTPRPSRKKLKRLVSDSETPQW